MCEKKTSPEERDLIIPSKSKDLILPNEVSRVIDLTEPVTMELSGIILESHEETIDGKTCKVIDSFKAESASIKFYNKK